MLRESFLAKYFKKLIFPCYYNIRGHLEDSWRLVARMEVIRPFLTVNVFGSKGCGKTSFKREWFDSSQARAISEIADVHIRIQASIVSWYHWA